MQTELTAVRSARAQYRAAFRSMACGGNWHICAGLVGVILLRNEEVSSRPVLVRNVQAMTEETMAVRLSEAIRRAQ